MVERTEIKIRNKELRKKLKPRLERIKALQKEFDEIVEQAQKKSFDL